MTSPNDLDRQLDAFLLDGPTALPDPSFDAVRDRTEATRQRAYVGPWRLPIMNRLVPLAAGVAVVAVAVVVGFQLLSPPAPGGVAAAPSSQPSPTPVPSPSASTAAVPPPLTQTFTSKMNGFSMSYPEGWTTRAATEPWTDRPGVAQFVDPGIDVLSDPAPDSNLFLYGSSRPIDPTTPEAWVADPDSDFEGCTPDEPITVDGANGLLSVECGIVAITTAGRGYRIAVYTPTAGEGAALEVAPYDRAWFEEVLATVRLQPGDAVDGAPSAAP